MTEKSAVTYGTYEDGFRRQIKIMILTHFFSDTYAATNFTANAHRALTNKSSLPAYSTRLASRFRRQSSVGEYRSEESDQSERTNTGMRNARSFLFELEEESSKDIALSNIIQVSDAGVSTCDPERAEIGVQTSISFVSLGSI